MGLLDSAISGREPRKPIGTIVALLGVRRQALHCPEVTQQWPRRPLNMAATILLLLLPQAAAVVRIRLPITATLLFWRSALRSIHRQ